MGGIFDGNHFNLTNWRRMLASVINRIDCAQIGLEVICPFGFEVLEDRRFFSKQLRRFYCYIGSKQEVSPSEVSEYELKFLKETFETLQSVDPDVAATIIIMAARTGDHLKLRSDDYLCAANDKLLVVEYRRCTTDLLSDYSDYLVCCLSGICEETLPEFGKITINRLARVRIYQLYIIIEKLFGHLLPGDLKYEGLIYRHLYASGYDLQYYYPQRSSASSLSSEEEEILIFIKRRVAQIFAAVSKKQNIEDEIRTVKCKAYHGDVTLSVTLSEEVYKKVCCKIRTTYIALNGGGSRPWGSSRRTI